MGWVGCRLRKGVLSKWKPGPRNWPSHSGCKLQGKPHRSRKGAPTPEKDMLKNEEAGRGPGVEARVGVAVGCIHTSPPFLCSEHLQGWPIILQGRLAHKCCKKPGHGAIFLPSPPSAAFGQVSSRAGPELCPGPGNQHHAGTGKRGFPPHSFFKIRPSTLTPQPSSVTKEVTGRGKASDTQLRMTN